MRRISVAGLFIDVTTKAELLEVVATRLRAQQKTFITTPYSEFLYEALVNPAVLETFNSADIAVCDGVGLMWAATYVGLSFRAKRYYSKVIEGLCQIVYSGAAILLRPSFIRTVISEKIPGSDLIWDLCGLAEQASKSVYLLGGFGRTTERAAAAIQKRFPRLRIAGTSNKNPDDPTIATDLKAAKPDLVFVAFGPITQERWISQHLPTLPITLAIGVGGTFDYLAGVKKTPPKFIRAMGLEWLFRLITQPKRIGRIKNATFGLVLALLRYKVLSSMPYRQNVVSVVLNKNNEVLLCQRKPLDQLDAVYLKAVRFENYWQMPQGGLDFGEELLAGAKRELFEETRIESVEPLLISQHVNRYEWKNGQRPLLGNSLKYKGQEQRIVYFKFTGNENEIRVDQNEFVNYKWVSLDQLYASVHEERKSLAKIVEQDSALF